MTRITFPQTVRLLSWIGDLLLISAAIAILIVKGSQLSVGYAGLLVLAIFLGGLLPIFVYGLEYLERRQATKAAEVAAPLTLRAALDQLERLVGRVETAASDASKTTLSARQIPGLLQDSSDALHSSLARLEDLHKALRELPDAEALTALVREGAPAPVLDLAPIEAAIAAIRIPQPPPVDLAPVEKAIAAIPIPEPPLVDLSALQAAIERLSAREVAIDLSPLENALQGLRHELENVALVREDKLESILEQLGTLEEMIADLPEAAAPIAEEKAAEKEEEKEEEMEEAPARKVPAAKPAKKKAAPPPPAPLDDLFGGAATTGLPRGQAALLVKALVGVENRVYARGDPPLRWDHGRPLEATGIGEWRLDLQGLEEPIEIELRLNDDIAAKGVPVRLAPGQVAHATPQFPPANEPF